MDNNKIKNKIEATFDNVCKRYDENKFFSLSARKMMDLLPENSAKKILDVSTGTGIVAIELAKKYPHADIEAIDLSQGMLKQAKIKANNSGFKHIVFKQHDVDNLPYEEASFDIISCGYALFFYPNMELSYQSLCKLLKPGGVFIFSSFTRDAFTPYAEKFLQRLEKDYQIKSPATVELLKTIQQVEQLAATSNLTNIKVVPFSICYSVTINDWWSLLNNAAFKGLIDQLTKEQLKQFKPSHLNEIQSLSDNGILKLNADTLFGIACLK